MNQQAPKPMPATKQDVPSPSTPLTLTYVLRVSVAAAGVIRHEELAPLLHNLAPLVARVEAALALLPAHYLAIADGSVTQKHMQMRH
jgi:hypothetical protein